MCKFESKETYFMFWLSSDLSQFTGWEEIPFDNLSEKRILVNVSVVHTCCITIAMRDMSQFYQLQYLYIYLCLAKVNYAIWLFKIVKLTRSQRSMTVYFIALGYSNSNQIEFNSRRKILKLKLQNITNIELNLRLFVICVHAISYS